MLRNALLACLLVAPLLSGACGGSSFVPEEGEAASAGTGGDTGGGSGKGGKGGSGANGGTGANGGSGANGGTSGTNTGGSGGSGAVGANGGDGAGGSGGSVDTGGSGGVGAVGGTTGGGGSTGGVGATGGGGMGGVAASETGGGSGLGGTCGVCPRIACAPPIMLTVMPSDQAGLIQDLTIDAPPELGITCYPGGGTPCSWWCQSVIYNPPAGEYSITLEAPGFAPTTLPVVVREPQSCGCCGCGCQPILQAEVVLESGTGSQGNCCADTGTDILNCGTCGNVCMSNVCTDGECAL